MAKPSVSLTRVLDAALRSRPQALNAATGTHVRFVSKVTCLNAHERRVTIPAGIWPVKFSGPLVGVYADKSVFKLLRITLSQLKVERKVTMTSGSAANVPSAPVERLRLVGERPRRTPPGGDGALPTEERSVTGLSRVTARRAGVIRARRTA